MEGRTKALAFKYVRQGCENYQLDGHTVKLHAGEFMLLPAEYAFQAGASPKKEVVKGVCIDFSSINSLLRDQSDPGALVYGLPLPFRELQLTQQTLADNSRAFSEAKKSKILACLQSDLEQLLPQMREREAVLQQRVKKQLTQKRLVQGLLNARNYVQDYYPKRITLNDLAKVAGISPYRLQRLFREVFGQSPQQMQLDFRMFQAKKLLSEQHLSMSEIAFELGYSDLAAFSNQFKRYFRCRPSEMRN